MEYPILGENRKKRLTIRLPMLICFAMFAAWQMGVIYFSGTALSIGGRTPLPVSINNITLIIVAGYAATITYLLLLPRFVVLAERITASAALLSALVLYLPLPPAVLAGAFYFQCFCCVFMIGFEMSLIINLFAEETAVLHLGVAYAVSSFIIAILQNDLIPVPFSGFRIFMVTALVMMLIFFFRLPANIWPESVKKTDGLVCPKQLFAGVFILIFFGSAMTVFGTAVAEKVPHGVSVVFLSSVVYELTVYFLWKKFHVHFFRSISVLVVLAALAFATAIAALYVPALSLLACVFMGSGFSILAFTPLFSLLLAKRYPSKIIAPLGTFIAFLPVAMQTMMLEMFRDRIQMVYIIYLVIAVITVVLYLKMEPVLTYSFGGRPRVPLLPKVDVPDNTVSGQVPPPPPEESEAIERIASAKTDNLRTRAVDHLSGQEIRLAELIMQGYGNAEMAEILHITGNTVKGYRKTLYSKLQIHSRRELFELAESAPPIPVGKGG